jgi:hypothetical protein
MGGQNQKNNISGSTPREKLQMIFLWSFGGHSCIVHNYSAMGQLSELVLKGRRGGIFRIMKNAP